MTNERSITNDDLTNQLILKLLEKSDEIEIKVVNAEKEISSLKGDIDELIKELDKKSDKNKFIIILKSKESMVALTTAAVIGFFKYSWDTVVSIVTKILT